MKENTVTKFWRSYINADYFQRRDKIKFIIETIDNLITIKDKKIRTHAISTLFSSYIGDLINVLEEQNENKKVG